MSTQAFLPEDSNDPQQETLSDVFVARQPIFSNKLQVYGFELLYRSSRENSFDGTTPAIATARVIANSFLSIGNEKILCGKVPFINFDASLLREFAPLLPFPHGVVEILESVSPNDDILAACRELKTKHYELALDNCATAESIQPWISTVNIVKVDFLRASSQTRQDIAAMCRQHHIRALAAKVETQEDYDHARTLGYDYFQG